MKIYKSKCGKLAGTSFQELVKAARREYHLIEKRNPRRRAYVRSQFFKHDKIFLDQFWEHLNQKNLGDKERRIALYSCAIDLMRHTAAQPEVVHEGKAKFYRFRGLTKDGQLFCVQILENPKSGRKYFISVFPA